MEHTNNSASRSSFLSALCILTFIGSTAGFIGYFLASIYFEQVSQVIISYSSWHSTENISWFYFTLLMVFYAFSLTGAIRIWKLQRDGFFIYFIAQLAILVMPVLWLNWNAFSFTNALFTMVFITGYGINLKRMN